MTGGRLARVADHLRSEESFCFTYGDGVADVDIGKVIAFHNSHGKQATITAVQPAGRYGALTREGPLVKGFIEKPQGDGGWVNGGFFVLSPACLNYIKDDKTVCEAEPLTRLAENGELMAYEHKGFWQPLEPVMNLQRWA